MNVMSRLLRTFIVTLAVFGLALAGPVRASCASATAAVEVPCASMCLNEDGPAQPQPDMPAKACPMLMCLSAPADVAEVAKTLEQTVSLGVRHVLPANLAMASANLAPEQRPPIS